MTQHYIYTVYHYHFYYYYYGQYSRVLPVMVADKVSLHRALLQCSSEQLITMEHLCSYYYCCYYYYYYYYFYYCYYYYLRSLRCSRRRSLQKNGFLSSPKAEKFHYYYCYSYYYYYYYYHNYKLRRSCSDS